MLNDGVLDDVDEFLMRSYGFPFSLSLGAGRQVPPAYTAPLIGSAGFCVPGGFVMFLYLSPLFFPPPLFLSVATFTSDDSAFSQVISMASFVSFCFVLGMTDIPSRPRNHDFLLENKRRK